MTDAEVDRLLNRAAAAPYRLDSALLQGIAASLKQSLKPVRPLSSPRALSAGVLLIGVAVALAGAARAGFYGFEKMDVLERAFIFPALGLFGWLAGANFVNSMIPASRRRLSPSSVLALATVALLALFAFLFRDYQTVHFVSVGIACLATGLLHAVPAGLLAWLALRRGFAVNPIAAGLAAGTAAGLAGVGVLELHCPNFQAAHILVWHTAVVPLSGALGAFFAWALRRRADSRASKPPR